MESKKKKRTSKSKSQQLENTSTEEEKQTTKAQSIKEDSNISSSTSTSEASIEKIIQDKTKGVDNEQKQEQNQNKGPTAFNLTEKTFGELEIADQTKKALEENGFTNMTEIQYKSIPHLLEGKDLLGKAKTGSGKTLSFLIPAIEFLYKEKWSQKNGTGVLVLTPTRELALQIYGVAHDLLRYHSFTHGVVMGGTNRQTEEQRLVKGLSLVIATPGRLLDHLQNTRGFLYKNLKCLIIDETDRILDIGFEEELHEIIKILPKNRQTMLFSATQTSKVEQLAKLSLKKAPVMVGVEEKGGIATVEGLEQGYVYHAELFNFIDIPVLHLHGKQKQQKRTQTFFEFINAKSGILLSTDVAARGLDIPSVDWIIQYDPPDDPKEYIHRVGRTARAGATGRALLFLLPEELGFLKYLKQAQVPLNEYEFPQNKIVNAQAQLEKLVEKNYYLHRSARDAYRSYLHAYASHSLKEIFNVQSLDLVKVAKSFGFSVPPKVNLNIHENAHKIRKRGGGGGLGSDFSARKKMKYRSGKGHPFSASNPRGKRDPEDKRQFQH